MNVYSLYRSHDHHFIVYGAMFLGQYTPALKAAQELIDTTPEELLRIPSPPMADFIEGYLSMKQHVLVRFGKWQEIIAQELPEGSGPLLLDHGDDALRQGRGAFGAGPDREGRAGARRLPRRPARVPESRRLHNNTDGRPARHRRRDADRRAGISPRQLRPGLRPSAPRRRARRFAALRRALGLDAADPPCARRAAAGAGPSRRGRGGLSRRSRLRRQDSTAPAGIPRMSGACTACTNASSAAARRSRRR